MGKNMKSKWTPEEIATIKNGFMAGKLVKIIAGEIGRSPTAVNKFLSRSGIRQRRWTIEKPRCKKEKIFEISRKTLNAVYTNEVTTDFREVLGYLEANGYAISKNSRKAFAQMDDYSINDKPVSGVKLLLMANRLRSEKHQPIFSVPELSWE